VLARAHSFAIDGLAVRRVTVEVDLRSGLPSFSVVGLADTSVREARERVRAALLNSDFAFPAKRITANLAPADLPKVGPGLDLALACALLAASGQLPGERLDRYAVFGELALGGELRGGETALALALAARRAGLEGLVLPAEVREEAALVDRLVVGGARDLREAVGLLSGSIPMPAPMAGSPYAPSAPASPSLEEVRGCAQAIRALTVAAAGGHNLLLCGPPGAGKTMLARRLPSILPPLSRREAIEVTRIQALARLRQGPGLVGERPFRAPHHHTSAIGLIGGRDPRRPGEVVLADHGVLFLDELSEFARDALAALRQPLEDRCVAVARGHEVEVQPARFLLVAATNPCPCGFAGHGSCRCSGTDLARHRRRLSGPLLDRMDLVVNMEPPTHEELARGPATTSAHVRELVVRARERQRARLRDVGASTNADLDTVLLARHVELAPRARAVLAAAHARGALSARGHVRVLRVARTIADLHGSDAVERVHILAALALRDLTVATRPGLSGPPLDPEPADLEPAESGVG
jgi:magnesium chelatase family protein